MPHPPEAEFTRLKDKGGLLYPSGCLFKFVENLEDLFTSCFSTEALHHDSVMDIVSAIRKSPQNYSVGCARHAVELTAQLVAFFVTTRLHFFVKSMNRGRAKKRKAAKYLKLSRCT